MDIVVQVIAIANPSDRDDYLRISDGQFWMDIIPKNEYKLFIDNKQLVVGHFIKIRTTTGTPKNNNFKLVRWFRVLF